MRMGVGGAAGACQPGAHNFLGMVRAVGLVQQGPNVIWE